MNIKKELIRLCIELDRMLNFSVISDSKFDKLDKKIVKLRKHISAIIQVEVDEDTEEYKKAAKEVKKATKAIEKAHQEIQDIAKTIAKIAKIIDAAAKAAASAAGP